ncbi:MAG: hypothetical protein RJQ21_18235 [Rhodospirillales bacterium]
MSAAGDSLDYDALVREFEDGLVNNLRRHGVGDDFLEMWVPDPDPVLGVLNMAEAAESYGLQAVSIRVSKTMVPEDRLAELETALGNLGGVAITDLGDAVRADIRIGDGG